MNLLAPLRPTSLRRRVTLSGVAIVTTLVLAFDVVVYLSLRDLMLSNLEDVLDAREQLARELLAEVGPLPPEEVSRRLDEVGLRSVIRTVPGAVFSSEGAPAFDRLPAEVEDDGPYAWREFRLQDGSQLFILTSRGGTDATLNRLLFLEIVGTVTLVALAYALLDRASAVVLRPVRDVAGTARRIADGRIQERLPLRDDDLELADMVSAFNGMLDELEDALAHSQAAEATSRRFLADAAHQLRNPVAGIRATVASLLRSDDPGERDRLTDALAREVARVSRLLSSLLRVARLDSLEAPTFRPTPLDDIAAAVVEHHRTLAPLHRFDVRAEGDCTAEVDATAVHEALSNLVDNAARHAEGHVRVEVAGQDGHVEVAVADDGPGVPAADVGPIFDRFVTRDTAGGSGLGLPIARGIAEAHDGDLSYRDGRFVLRLPRVHRA
ncbi:MAG: HAMP domain-containing histidine kinase [Actinobacteria bacterium]|nr:HAMP domain-containing histidine kinase [Actinomycetota bacterium]